MADVFLSYSRRDKALAAQFVELLEGQGWDVFWDQETRAGEIWPKVLEDELNRARCLVVLWTSTSATSRWVRIEAYEALQSDKLLPVRLEAVKPPMEFRQTQTFDLIGWTGQRDDPRLPHLFADLAALAKFDPGNGAASSAAAGGQEPPASRNRSPPESSTQARTGVAAESAKAATDEWSTRRSRLWWGFALAPVALAIVWIVSVVAPGTGAPGVAVQPTTITPPPQEKSPAPQEQSPPPKVVDASPAPPVRVPEPKPATVSTASPNVKPQRVVPARCLEIADRFQTTGQLTDDERRYLGSKECAR